MSRHDVVVFGAGLAGPVLRPRPGRGRRRRGRARGPRPARRPGGADRPGRRACGPARRRGGRSCAHGVRGLVAELGLTLEPAFPSAARRGHLGAGGPGRGRRRRPLARPRPTGPPTSAPSRRSRRLAAHGGPRRPVVAPGRGAAGPAVGRGLPARPRARRRPPCGPVTWRCSRWARSRSSAPRCWPTCARRRPSAPDRLLRVRDLGVPAGRRGLGDRRAGGWRTALGPRLRLGAPVRSVAVATRRLPGRARHRRDAALRRGRLARCRSARCARCRSTACPPSGCGRWTGSGTRRRPRRCSCTTSRSGRRRAERCGVLRARAASAAHGRSSRG